MITSYKELTIDKYVNLEGIVLGYPDDVERNTLVLSVLTGKSYDELMALPIADYTALNRKAAFLATPPDPKIRIASSYRVGEYELIPTKDYRKLTTAQYVDFQAYVKQYESDAGGLVFILSCFLVPKGHTYCDGGYEPEHVQDAIRKYMSVEDALVLHRFFFQRSVSLMRHLTTSLIAKADRLERSAKRMEKLRKATVDKDKRMDLIRQTVLMKTEAKKMLSLIDGGGLQTSTPYRRLSDAIGIVSGE